MNIHMPSIQTHATGKDCYILVQPQPKQASGRHRSLLAAATQCLADRTETQTAEELVDTQTAQ